ncbi:helix-turn-helix domain-containing protein [Gloeothece verrucosa]|uniref:Transcriptional regulator, XRE family n=1 Tax=Gloeothece verrucosa (strain PCC 7822) TaxID=497965 RepID=E0UN95_GLOV7|nr:helix-turn-helix transcriptional regulator [Gloeothece verrucosa]ADN18425.1 transcriptional regulator, XRE family [Gloeothece verrucosa PCC 7822]
MFLTATRMDMKELREKAGLSAEEAAFKLGVAHSTIRNWESGKTEPSLGVTKISELLRLYQCTFEQLEEAVRETRTKIH